MLLGWEMCPLSKAGYAIRHRCFDPFLRTESFLSAGSRVHNVGKIGCFIPLNTPEPLLYYCCITFLIIGATVGIFDACIEEQTTSIGVSCGRGLGSRSAML